MKEMIFTVGGRDLEAYQLTNRQMVDIIKGDKRPISDERDYLMQKVLKRFEIDLCPRCGEDDDDVFARFFGNFVNGKMHSKEKVAERMAMEHRYLQSEMFKVCLAYIKKLSENYENHSFDARNEWACMVSFRIQGFIETL